MGIAAACVFGVALVSFVVLYNGLIRHKNMVKEAWSGIDVQLKRRHDLIPKLVETVKGSAQYERKLLEDLTRLRTESMASGAKDKGRSEESLSQSLRSVLAVAENYPDLKANTNFLELQKSLTDVENQLQFARRYYNGTVRDLNIRISAFPSIIVARLFGFAPEDYFGITQDNERQSPETPL